MYVPCKIVMKVTPKQKIEFSFQSTTDTKNHNKIKHQLCKCLGNNTSLSDVCTAGYGYSHTEAPPLYTCACAFKRLRPASVTLYFYRMHYFKRQSGQLPLRTKYLNVGHPLAPKLYCYV